MNDTRCHDCRVDTLPLEAGELAEFYMVRNHIWTQAVPEGHGKPGRMAFFLCVGCLEARLGRTLTAADFTDAPINDLSISNTLRFAWSWRTTRLIERLQA